MKRGVFEKEGICKIIDGCEEDCLDFGPGEVCVGASAMIDDYEGGYKPYGQKYRVKIRVEWERIPPDERSEDAIK